MFDRDEPITSCDSCFVTIDVIDSVQDDDGNVLCGPCSRESYYSEVGDPHANRRDERRGRDALGMQVTNRSLKSTIQPLLGRKRSRRRER